MLLNEIIFSMENILVAGSNLYAIRGIAAAYSQHKVIEVILLFMSMLSSMAYHLIERSKHHMKGIIRHDESSQGSYESIEYHHF